jgi:hypothetical protein
MYKKSSINTNIITKLVETIYICDIGYVKIINMKNVTKRQLSLSKIKML